MSSPDRKLLARLTEAPGAPGNEGAVRAIVREALADCGEIAYDRLGSLLCTQGSGTPRVVLDAHMDEVGFLVQSISERGQLNFIALGGWWGHVLPAQRVSVITAQGPVPGVIGSTPPHFLKPEQRKEVQDLAQMYIDVGAESAERVAELGIRVGDSVVPDAEFRELAVPGVLSAKAFDCRAGCGVLCESMRALSDGGHPGSVIGVAAVQEEVGTRGAGTAMAVAQPDVAIVLEATPADDTPGAAEVPQGVLGAGPQVRISDPSALSNRRLVRVVEEVAAREEIPVQLAVRVSGGTDARPIHVHDRGVPTTVIGVPARYIHTHVSLIDWNDYCAAVRLVVATVRALDAETVAGLTDFTDS